MTLGNLHDNAFMMYNLRLLSQSELFRETRRQLDILIRSKAQSLEEIMLSFLNKNAYKLAVLITLLAVIFLVWLSVGVGIIGADGDPANRMYYVVAAIGVIGALVTRLRAFGMMRVLLAMALGQAIITGIAMIAKLGLPYSGPMEILLLNGFFIVAFLEAAWLFRRAAGGLQA